MLHIAITAGGTSENIDGVRKLTNMSTGRLGWHCLKALLNYFQKKKCVDFRLHYILTETAYRGDLSDEQQPFVNFISVTDAASVYETVNDLTLTVSFDYFIHSMAISDFTLSYIASTYDMAREISSCKIHDGADEIAVREVLENPKISYRVDEKISSNDAIIMGLKPTRKVIPLIKQNNPKTFLVGFKLLKNVSDDELIRVANQLADKNECDIVFANETAHISENNHRGILIKNGEIIARPVGKHQIAKTIVEKMMSGLVK